ncbi:DUF7638 domain-containing protein [Limnovirga soli]|uniref:Uncharacterized protein n=1 Tax=Limnovirga soli TaxID=2656915 RepID=A0A8J8FGV2_9BACT|nr:hypothetical protein [Limnovirga soli]NNV57825.1 hypothetical protein [Limnovirga soli]
MIKPSTKVYRKQIIEGFSIPAIIHNINYFFVDLDVYENGRVHCWNFEDFEHFKKDVQRGWVVLNIPDNNDISIHGLGSWTIENGSWLFNKKTFIDYVQRLIKELNPSLENIFKYKEKKVNGITVGENGGGIIYKEKKKTPNSFFSEKVNGQSINLFYKTTANFHLIKVNLFADGTLQLSRLENPIDLSIEEFEKLIIENNLVTEIPIGSTVYIYGLGEFSIKKMFYNANIQDKLLEIKDIQRQLKGEPTTIEICRQAHEKYLKNPTLENKEQLRVAYENVPDHQKIYVGDMDTKDIEVRMIIYGEQEIQNWSHYILAKEMGEELPTITVPKPIDEKNNS